MKDTRGFSVLDDDCDDPDPTRHGACAITRNDTSGVQAVYCWDEPLSGNGEFSRLDVHPPVVVQGL